MRGSWRPNKDCNILTPQLFWLSQPFFPVLLGCSTGACEGAALCWELVSTARSGTLTSSSELQLLNQGSWGPPLLGAGSLYSILSPTNSKVLCTELYYCFTPTQFNPSTVEVIPWYPQPDAPVIYTSAFLILTAWPGRRSICNNTKNSVRVIETSLFNTQHYKTRIKGKEEQSKERSTVLLITLV